MYEAMCQGCEQCAFGGLYPCPSQSPEYLLEKGYFGHCQECGDSILTVGEITMHAILHQVGESGIFELGPFVGHEIGVYCECELCYG